MRMGKDGCQSRENLFGQSELLMNIMYIVFPKGIINSWNDHCIPNQLL